MISIEERENLAARLGLSYDPVVAQAKGVKIIEQEKQFHILFKFGSYILGFLNDSKST